MLSQSLIYVSHVVTGTSTGIGQASVKEVIAAGECVATITRKASSVSKLTTAYSSDKLFIIEYDVGSPTHSAEALFKKVCEHFGCVDIVVNNAGYGSNSVIEGTSNEDARYQFEVNFWGTIHISHKVGAYWSIQQIGVSDHTIRYFCEHKTPTGCIINISSAGGFSVNPTLAFYSASKFTLKGFSKGLHKELPSKWNIKVITIQPESVRTDWAKSNMVDHPLPPAYDAPDSPANKMHDLYKSTPYTGDAVKFSRVLITISQEANPPLRLPLGADSQHIILNKLNEIKKEVKQWNQLTLSLVADNADSLFFKKLNAMLIEKS